VSGRFCREIPARGSGTAVINDREPGCGVSRLAPAISTTEASLASRRARVLARTSDLASASVKAGWMMRW
jgi:hypothetical protein